MHVSCYNHTVKNGSHNFDYIPSLHERTYITYIVKLITVKCCSFRQWSEAVFSQPGWRGRSVSIVLVGHSYVRRLCDYMATSQEHANLGLHGVEVHCVGVGRATLRPGDRNIRNFLRAVSQHRPFIVYVHIGENDLGHMSDGHITSEILRLMSVLSPLSRSRVVILGQLVSFPRTRSRHQTSVRLINDDLRQRIGAPNIYWRHEYEFANSSLALFLPDGVQCH